MNMNTIDINYKVSFRTYVTCKYIFPVIIPFVAITMSFAILYMSGQDDVTLRYFAIMPMIILALALYFYGKNILYMRQAYVNSRGIGFDDSFVSWREVKNLQEPFFGRRIEVHAQKDNALVKFSFPLPFLGWQYQWPSEFYKGINKVWLSEK